MIQRQHTRTIDQRLWFLHFYMPWFMLCYHMTHFILCRRNFLVFPLSILHKKSNSFLRISSNTCNVTLLPSNTADAVITKSTHKWSLCKCTQAFIYFFSHQTKEFTIITSHLTLRFPWRSFRDTAWVMLSVTHSVTAFPWRSTGIAFHDAFPWRRAPRCFHHAFRDTFSVTLSKCWFPSRLSVTLHASQFPWCIPWQIFHDAPPVSLSMTPFHDTAPTTDRPPLNI